MDTSRIPELEGATFTATKAWFKAMAKRGLLYHPNDAADQIISNKSGRRLFSSDECLKLDAILGRMFERFGDEVYTAAYPVFMKEFRALIKH